MHISQTKKKTHQINNFGIYFDYKLKNQSAWLYCTMSLAIGLLLMSTLHENPFITLMTSSSVINIQIGGFISSLHEMHTLTGPSLTYVYLLRKLQERFAVLNQLLRYCFSV